MRHRYRWWILFRMQNVMSLRWEKIERGIITKIWWAVDPLHNSLPDLSPIAQHKTTHQQTRTLKLEIPAAVEGVPLETLDAINIGVRA
ncbi:hypothetical protein C5167_035017 [Papaver somniferum]|uniref:Uncharacterized protein n=1 Tax=Papaver somniferum TaxID=3469 RepID=A0A4Y7KGB5_PAPSO|nr:hypothetical protein C5167_035017 [Papaver somniferum]